MFFFDVHIKLNLHRNVTVLQTLALGTCSSYKFVAKTKRDSSSGSLSLGQKNFFEVPQFEPNFKLSSNFSMVLSC
jgi:hypothetical protein